MPLEDHQLRAADHGKDLDNQDRNAVREQTQEPYGDEAMHAETQTVTMQHFPGQPLETVTDHEANEEVRAERYERALVDPVFRAQNKIEISDEDQERDDYVADDGLALGIHTPLPDDVDPDPDLAREDALDDAGRTDVDQQLAAGSDSMHPVQPVLAPNGQPADGSGDLPAGTPVDEDDHPGEPPLTPDEARSEQSDADQAAVADAAPRDHSNDRGGE